MKVVEEGALEVRLVELGHRHVLVHLLEELWVIQASCHLVVRCLRVRDNSAGSDVLGRDSRAVICVSIRD